MLLARLEGAERLLNWLDRADAELGDTRALFRTMGNVIVRDSQQAFRSQGWHGRAWAPLSPATQEAGIAFGPRKRKRGGGNILHPTGVHLLNTIGILELRNGYVRVGTPTPWAHVHNAGATLQGTAFGTITIPERRFIGLDETNLRELDKAVGFWLERSVLQG